MVMKLVLVVATLAVAVLFPLAGSSTGACDSKGNPSMGEIEGGDGTQSGTWYLDDRNYALGNGIWMYIESNGIWTGGDVHADLQRGGSSATVPDDNEICVDDPNIPSDNLIF